MEIRRGGSGSGFLRVLRLRRRHSGVARGGLCCLRRNVRESCLKHVISCRTGGGGKGEATDEGSLIDGDGFILAFV